MGGGYASSGFEIGNLLDRRAYPVARVKRPGPPPSTQPADFDPTQLRGAPIRARPLAFDIREDSGRALVAFGPFVGPGLVKRLTLNFLNSGSTNPMPHLNLVRDTAPYVTGGNLALTNFPHGTAIFEAQAQDDVPRTMVEEGGLVTPGVTSNGVSFLLDVYIAETQFFLALDVRATAGFNLTAQGMLLVYEGILVTDFPMILG